MALSSIDAMQEEKDADLWDEVVGDGGEFDMAVVAGTVVVACISITSCAGFGDDSMLLLVMAAGGDDEWLND